MVPFGFVVTNLHINTPRERFGTELTLTHKSEILWYYEQVPRVQYPLRAMGVELRKYIPSEVRLITKFQYKIFYKGGRRALPTVPLYAPEY